MAWFWSSFSFISWPKRADKSHKISFILSISTIQSRWSDLKDSCHSDIMSNTCFGQWESLPSFGLVRTQHSMGLWQAFLPSLSPVPIPSPNPRKPAMLTADVVTKLMTSSLHTLPRLTNQQAWNKFHNLFHHVVFNNTANFALPIAPTTLAIFLLLTCSIRTMRHPLHVNTYISAIGYSHKLFFYKIF